MQKQIFTTFSEEEFKSMISSVLDEPINYKTIKIGNIECDIINRVELCKRLNITEPTAIRFEKKGKIPCFRIGSSVRYNWQKVIEKLEGKGVQL